MWVDHEDRVAQLGSRVAQTLGYDDSRLRVIELACAFHDVGKLAIPDEIIEKPSALTTDEYAIVKSHSIVGERVMNGLDRKDLAKIIRSHHERWDGAGYPDGLKGNEIPFGARLICVVDAYDAMTSNRVYRLAMTNGQALAEVRRCTSKQFDPECAYALELVLGVL